MKISSDDIEYMGFKMEKCHVTWSVEAPTSTEEVLNHGTIFITFCELRVSRDATVIFIRTFVVVTILVPGL